MSEFSIGRNDIIQGMILYKSVSVSEFGMGKNFFNVFFYICSQLSDIIGKNSIIQECIYVSEFTMCRNDIIQERLCVLKFKGC